LTVTVDPRHPTPLHAQLSQAIRGAIASGRLGAGEQLPTVRQLAVELSINANTVSRVYVELERAGILETQRGVGTFVAKVQPAGVPTRGRESELHALVARCLDEAAAKGFTVADVVRRLKHIAGSEGG
jgi:GntR family transcriptional regulator